MNPSLQPGLVLDPVFPAPLIALLGVVLLLVTILAYRRTGAAAGKGRSLALLLFRLAGLAIVVLLLLQPSRRELLPPPTRERIVVVALDTSLSMKQRDVQGGTRFDAAKNLLLDSGIAGRSGIVSDPRLRLFGFSDNAEPIASSILELVPRGKTTRLHKSVTTLLASPAAGEAVNAVLLLTDGHDFELVNPARTGAAARARDVPVYAVPLGKQGKVRDVAARITGYQPYCYVKQQARLNAALRLIGCELEDITVQLLRQGQVVQTKRFNAGEAQELPVEFTVTEPEIGQFEYEIRALPLEHELDPANNSAITYLNVIDQQIRALLLEGDPYWDTTFLQRSLMRNDKFELDALIRFAKDRVRAIRKNPDAGPFRVPENADQFNAYDLVILGRAVDQILAPAQILALNEWVENRGGTVVFSRGRAFAAGTAGELEPVIWGETVRDRVRLEPAPEGRNLSALQSLDARAAGTDALPELLAGRDAAETRPLTSTLATASGRDDATPAPAIVHRRYGRGQVVSVGVAGLWRWALNAKVDGPNTPFDRFWDQLSLWLLAGRDFIPSRQYSFRPNSANIMLGEKITFRLNLRQAEPGLKSVPVSIYFGDAPAGRLNLMMSADPARLTAEYMPERIGRYRAEAAFPDGTSQELRFIVFTENLEETEVATDALCLRRLCESSGGRLLEPEDLSRFVGEMKSQQADQTPKTRLRPVWNAPWVLYVAGLWFGLDWFLRRRWGLC